MMSARSFCPSCHQEVAPTWSFCAHCGADNRPPAMRWPVAEHPHLLPTGAHCVFCGQARGAVDDFGAPASRVALMVRKIGFAVLTLGIAGVAFVQAFAGMIEGRTRPLAPGFGPMAEGVWARIFGAAWLAIGCLATIWFLRRAKLDFGG